MLFGVQPQLLQPRRYSMSVVTASSLQNIGAGNSPFRERLGSNRLPDKPRPRSSSKVERGRVSPATEVVLPTSTESTLSTSEDNEEGPSIVSSLLKSTATLQEILTAMCQSKTGIEFLLSNSNLPKMTFISADAVYWIITNVEGTTLIQEATAMLDNMIKQHLICHASGDTNKHFVFGFYLYYVVKFPDDNVSDNSDSTLPIGDLQMFENEWMEVEVKDARGWGGAEETHEADVPHFLCETIQNSYLQGDADVDVPLYRHTHLETDVTLKSDRTEWAHLRYQTIYRPDQPYELQVQWLTSSAAIISELIFGWARKAQACGLQMIPIPADLLSLPFGNKSDPLRGPIFIPLNVDCLMNSKTYLFEEFREETWAERLFLFQESIVAQFGFMACSVETLSSADSTVIHDHQYVHRSGNVFILIPSPLTLRPRQRLTSVNQRRPNSRYPISSEPLSSPHHAYITRHVSGKNKDEYETSKKMGFLWSWNHMLTRRWRSNSTAAAGDDAFQANMLRDFKEFCSNADGRLRSYWEKCWEIKERASIK